jgi:hypothetical protein
MGRFFVPVARVRTCSYVVFGKELFRDCSVGVRIIGRMEFSLGTTEIVRTTAPFFG